MESQTLPDSPLAFRAALDLFSLPKTDISVLKNHYQIVYPTNAFADNSNPIEFNILGSTLEYYCPKKTFMYLKCKIVKRDGSALAGTEDVAPGQHFFAQMWDSVETFINGVSITKYPDNYGPRHHILSLLKDSQDAKSTILTSELYYRDNAKNSFVTGNPGYSTRKALAKSSEPFEMIGYLADPICKQGIKYTKEFIAL